MAKKISSSVGKGGSIFSGQRGQTLSVFNDDSDSDSEPPAHVGNYNFMLEIAGVDAGTPGTDPGGFQTDPGKPGSDPGATFSFKGFE